MKNLLATLLSILFVSVLCGTAQSTASDSDSDGRQAWIESVLDDEGISVRSKDYIFYCTGHHGFIWSLITSDSSGMHFYNGTSRKHIKEEDPGLPDTLSFIKDNIKTITWGFDSLADAAQLLTPLKSETYITLYTELEIVKDGKMVFRYTNDTQEYAGPDSKRFKYNLSSLGYLMLWLAMPSLRQDMPCPDDTLLAD